MKCNELAFPPLPEHVTAAAKKMGVRPPRRPAWTGGPISTMAFTAMVFILCFESSRAANWYVRPSSAGSNNGTSWTNAWSISSLNSNWASVKPGDIVWLAGGRYTTSLQPGTNGTAANNIFVKRVLSSDPVPVAAAGWSSSFDAQVVIEPNGSSNNNAPLQYNRNIGSHFVFDGRVWDGIKFFSDNTYTDGNQGSGTPYGALQFGYGSGGQTDIEWTNCEIAGPYPNDSGGNTLGSIYCVCLYNYQGTFAGVSNFTWDHCDIHGGVDAFSIAGAGGNSQGGSAGGMIDSVIQYCELHGISSSSGNWHSNLMELHACGNNIFRYNNVHDWQIEGFFFLSGGEGVWNIYGNIFHDPVQNASSRFMELEGGNTSTNGPIYVYNNTFVNIPLALFSGAGSSPGSYSSSSMCENNIFWNIRQGNNNGGIFQRWNGSHDYNYFGGGNPIEGGESHGVNGSGATPFVQVNGNTSANFQIVAATGSNYPRNLGVALATDGNINKDLLGGTRGADGSWDIGAYEYSNGSTGTPTPIPATVQNVRFN